MNKAWSGRDLVWLAWALEWVEIKSPELFSWSSESTWRNVKSSIWVAFLWGGGSKCGHGSGPRNSGLDAVRESSLAARLIVRSKYDFQVIVQILAVQAEHPFLKGRTWIARRFGVGWSSKQKFRQCWNPDIQRLSLEVWHKLNSSWAAYKIYAVQWSAPRARALTKLLARILFGIPLLKLPSPWAFWHAGIQYTPACGSLSLSLWLIETWWTCYSCFPVAPFAGVADSCRARGNVPGVSKELHYSWPWDLARVPLATRRTVSAIMQNWSFSDSNWGSAHRPNWKWFVYSKGSHLLIVAQMIQYRPRFEYVTGFMVRKQQASWHMSWPFVIVLHPEDCKCAWLLSLFAI